MTQKWCIQNCIYWLEFQFLHSQGAFARNISDSSFFATFCPSIHHFKSAICFQGANWTYYDNFSAFQCLACAEGCDDCVDASPCIVSLNMVLRSILLVLQCVIIGKTSHGFRIIKEKWSTGTVENYFHGR